MRGVIQDDREAKTIVEAACCTLLPIVEPFSGLVFFDDTRTIGAAVFNNYNGRDVHFSCTLSEGDVGMKIARCVAWYVFKNLDCHRCTAITARTNVKAWVALEKIGFRWEGVLREHFPDNVDGIVMGLLRSEQRLLRELK
jgi:RimJ/RimL family protein N-acetyltransferase